jgi:hypothetical protein
VPSLLLPAKEPAKHARTEMKRDMDLIRDLLLAVDDDPRFDGTMWITPDEQSDNLGVLGVSDHSYQEVAYHLTMLVEAGYLNGKTTMEMPIINKLTWEGHELLDDIRDPSIWKKTKERMKGVTTVGIGIIGEIAKAEIKKHLGLP